MYKPAYKIIIGRKFFDTTDEPKASNVVDLSIALDMETPADSATLLLGNVNSLKPKEDDQLKISLGYEEEDELTQVMVGSVVTVEPGLTTNRVIGYSGTSQLLRTFVDHTYENKTAGDIIRDLVSRAGGGAVDTPVSSLPVGGAVGNAVNSAIAGFTGDMPLEVATAEDGISFPAYVVDSQRSAYHHMRDLAELCGFDLYINAEGKLVFEAFTSGKTVHVFEYAKHILSLDIQRTPLRAAQVEAWGESAAGRGGENAWAWLTNDFSSSRGTAGSGGARLLLERPALRTAAAADTAARAALTHLQRQTLRGRLQVLGNPQVKLGDAIRLAGLADDSLNQNYQVRGVYHRITKINGFITTIAFRCIT